MKDISPDEAAGDTGELPAGAGGCSADPARTPAAAEQPDAGKYRLLSLADVDKRTIAYRETRRVLAGLEADLGGADALSTAERQLAQHAAVLAAILCDLEVKYIQRRLLDPATFCTVLNAQRRTLEALGLRRRPRDVTPSVEEYVRTLPPKG